MSETEDEYWARLESESNDQLYAEEAERTRKESEAFKAKWPNACTGCGGWGGFHRPSGSRWEPDDYDACDGPKDGSQQDNIHYCHRCGQDGLDDDANGPCTHCGWDHDDGDPAALPGAMM